MKLGNSLAGLQMQIVMKNVHQTVVIVLGSTGMVQLVVEVPGWLIVH